MTTNQLLDLLSFAIAWTIGAIFTYFRRKDVIRLPATYALAIFCSFFGFGLLDSFFQHPSNFIVNVIGATVGTILGILLSFFYGSKTKSKDDTDIHEQK